jgi:hypothetical protein
MKKIIIALVLIFSTIVGYSQKRGVGSLICVSANCKDTIIQGQDTLALNSLAASSAPITSYVWRANTGTTVTIDNVSSANTVARGFATKAVGWYSFTVTAASSLGTASAIDSIYVKAAPPPPVKTLVVTIVNFNGTAKTLSVFSDGTTTLK